jgi:ankyrin repeat protein
VNELLLHGAVVDCIDAPTQSTSLILAATGGHLEVAQTLIRAGADVNASNCYGNTALHEACRQGFADIAELLLKHRAYAQVHNKKGSTPLHFLSYGESAETHPISLARKLIDAGAAVDARDNRGVSPLLACCSSGR